MATTEDQSKIVRDGERVRVPLIMMDELQKSVSAARLHDGMGNPAGSKPGFVFMTGLDRSAVHSAHVTYEQCLGDSWKPPSADTEIDAGSATATKTDAYQRYLDHLGSAWRPQ